MPRPPEDIQTVRIPLLGESTARATTASKDQRFVNGYFDVLKNSVTNKEFYFFTKRAGLTQLVRPTGGAATARGMYVWRGSIFTCYGTKLYKGSTDLGVTLTTSTGQVSFEETRPSAASPVLACSDGVSLYVIDTSDGVTVLNNVVITSSSVANPTVITTTTPHGLATGNKVVIRDHAGSTPGINGTLYTVTVTGASTFTIPVNVTVGGTGGTLGVFPTPNLVKLIYFDGYLFLLKTDGSIVNCTLDDPRSWEPTAFIVPIMDNGAPAGITRQSNFIYAFGNKWTQGFYNAANATGSPLANYEQMMLQIGCASRDTITNEESFLTWVGSSDLGGFTVYRLAGVTGLKDIGDPTINRVLNSEGSSLSSSRASLIRVSGHTFYVLTLPTAARTFVYDYDLEMWFEWTGTDGSAWPILVFDQYTGSTIAQHATNGWIYYLSPTVYQDDSVSFPVLARFGRNDLDTIDRKFVKSVDLLGDKQTSSTVVSLQYSDDDYQTLSTARSFDMSDVRPYGTNFGSFRRRAWQVSYTGSGPLRLEALQIKYRLGTP